MGALWSSFLALNPTEAAALVAGGVSIFVGLITVLVSLAVAKRSTYITAVTTQRSKWIDSLRENIAELLGTCSAIHLRHSDLTSDGARTLRETADRLIALITMQLNPKNPIDKNMIGLIGLFPTRAEMGNDTYRELERAFVRHAQFLLKEEWEKVKSEAMGWLCRIVSWYKKCVRAHEYKEFCKRPESLANPIPRK